MLAEGSAVLVRRWFDVHGTQLLCQFHRVKIRKATVDYRYPAKIPAPVIDHRPAIAAGVHGDLVAVSHRATLTYDSMSHQPTLLFADFVTAPKLSARQALEEPMPIRPWRRAFYPAISIASAIARASVQGIGNAFGFFFGERVQRGVTRDHVSTSLLIDHTPEGAVLPMLSNEPLAISIHALGQGALPRRDLAYPALPHQRLVKHSSNRRGVNFIQAHQCPGSILNKYAIHAIKHTPSAAIAVGLHCISRHPVCGHARTSHSFAFSQRSLVAGAPLDCDVPLNIVNSAHGGSDADPT